MAGSSNLHLKAPADRFVPPPSQGTPICLYNTQDDPEQEHNLSAHHPVLVEKLLGAWQAYRDELKEKNNLQLNLSPEFIKELQATGYDFR